ncbi:hypothetical protein CXF67_04535 [Psychroflexus sp. MES1-P1E]|nr:hypothetical protein CXF67_04535 [Psychroflexus sp. MES1-P1E]
MFSINVFTQVKTPIQVDFLIGEGIELMFQTQHAQSLELLTEAQNTAKKNQLYDQFFRATLNIGSNYYMLSDYGEALQYYLQAYEIAIEHLGSRQEMAVLNNVGALYLHEQELSQAKKYFLKAYKKAKQIKDDDKVGYYGVNLALVSNKRKEADSAHFYIQEALPLLRDIPNILLVGKMAQAEMFLLKKQYTKSEEIALSLLPDLKDISQIENKVFILLVLAQISEGRNKIDKALYYATQAKNAKEGFENRTEIYDYLSELYGKTGDFEKAIAYKDSVIVATDSLNTIRNRKLFENEKVKFQFQNYQHELSESKEVLKQERRFFYSIISIALLGIVFIFWVFRSNSIKHKQRKKIVELELVKEKGDHLLIEKQLREREALALLEQERLKNELELKNRKLIAKALYLSSKNDLIEEVIQSISLHTEISTNHSLKKQIMELKKHLKNDTQWDSFFTHFEEINQGFLDRLKSKHSKLTSNDIRFITYLYMNLSNKEIASLLNITPQSCRKRKERISNKLELPSGIMLHDYLSRI